MGKGKKDERVNVSVSHMGLADGLRPLGKTKTKVNTSTQLEKGNPISVVKKALWDVTN